MTQKPSNTHRYLGMTGGQLAVVAIFGVLLFAVLIVGILLLLDRSSLVPPVAQVQAPAPQVVQATLTLKAVQATPTPLPPTATPVPLDEILILPGDLPPGYTGAQIRTEAPGTFPALPSTETVLYQQIQSNGRQIGSVTLFVYQGETDLKKAYSILKGGLGESKSLSGLGDEATFWNNTTFNITVSELVFRHCRALVYVRMTAGVVDESSVDESSVVGYAKRLDKRLQQIVCQ